VRHRALAAAFLLAATASACTSGPDGVDGPEPTGVTTGATGVPAPDASMTLRVMEFNVEYGGNEVDFDAVPEVIEASGADIVAIEEGYGNMPAIAGSVGWEHYDPRTQVMSRFPLLSPPGDEPFTYVEVAPGAVVAVANVHLPSTSYGPSKLLRGAGVDELVAIEEHKRLPALAPALNAVEQLAAQDVPVFLIGDFNAPSHLDWTQEAVGIRDHVRFPVEWPVSLAVEEAGLVDSYREVNPDPVADQGLTWPADRPFVQGYNPYDRGAPADRIDFVYAGGPATTLESQLVGEEGGDGVDVAVSPWPTDHRATVSTFDVVPAPAPTIVSVERRLVPRGGELVVRFHSPSGAGSIVVRAVDAGNREPGAANAWPLDGAASGELSREISGRWEPGAYEVVLRSETGRELSSAMFWVQPADGEPAIGTAEPTYDVGEPFEVVWRFSPGNRWDWVGVYRRGANPGNYLLWVYTHAMVEGSAGFDRDSVGAWPLPPGEYSVYLLRDDSYVELARGDFTIR
jgi:hypothetical protein